MLTTCRLWKCMPNPTRDKYCSLACFLPFSPTLCMHISCRQGLGERGNSNAMWHSLAVWVSLIILSYIQEDLQMDQRVLSFWNRPCLHDPSANPKLYTSQGHIFFVQKGDMTGKNDNGSFLAVWNCKTRTAIGFTVHNLQLCSWNLLWKLVSHAHDHLFPSHSVHLCIFSLNYVLSLLPIANLAKLITLHCPFPGYARILFIIQTYFIFWLFFSL